MRNKISILKLSVYSEVMDIALIVDNENVELKLYREQHRKKTRINGAHCSQLHIKILI